MHKFSIPVVALLLLGIVFVSVASSQPGEGIRYGRATVHLIGNAQEQYDSNIFLTPNGEKSDWISTLSPGVRIEWPFGVDNLFKAGYLADFVIFAQHEKESGVNHTADASLEFYLRDIKFAVGDVFKKVYDRPDTETTQRLSRILNTAWASAAAEYNRVGYEIGYKNEIIHYLTDGYENDDRDDNYINLIGTYRIFTKTQALVEFDYGNISYVKKFNPDANFYQGLIGVRGKLTEKCTAEIKGGWQYRDYTRPTTKDYDGLVTTASIQEDFTERDIFKITWLRTPFESLYVGPNFYVANNITGRYIHKFTEKLSANAGASYQLSTYPNDTTEDGVTKRREDNTWGVGAGVEYAMQKWAIFKTGYEFKQRQSNFGTFNFNDNLVTASVNLMY